MSTDELRVSKIRDGTVIDHISSGYALDVVRILGITGKEHRVMTIAVNVPSKLWGVKDIVKIEGRVLSVDEVNRIALVAPYASINVIRDFVVVEKFVVKPPSVVSGFIRCVNSVCITNSNEPVGSKFSVGSVDPLVLRCHYCACILEKNDVMSQMR
ncbi:MAG: aspartate carbamoyltransferase regulatory subunit [Nitrososphaerota archaeon]|jgi:aspartate carbamoyltransferase regulatory subunit|nr:aspartate carbamoyltransferase regulatory subunit [Nitrososphaerota archaeon]